MAAAPPNGVAAMRSGYLAAMRLVPNPIVIIATQHEGTRRGLAATAWNSLTADPPMMLACINQGASAHPWLLKAKSFSISLLDGAHAETAAIFSAQRELQGDERFLPGVWEEGTLGQPILVQAVTAFECRLADVHDYRTHSLLIGEVASIRTRVDGEALLYLNGRYARATEAPLVDAPLRWASQATG